MTYFKRNVVGLFMMIALSVSWARFTYEGYKVIKMNPSTDIQFQMLKNLQETQPDFDVLNHVRAMNENVYVLLSPDAFLKYKKIFDLKKVQYQVVNDDFKTVILQEQESIVRDKRQAKGPLPTAKLTTAAKSIVGKFARYNEIVNYVDQIVAANPGFASSYIAGNTYEKRGIKTLVLKTATAKRGIFIDCGIHAREWIAISSCIWFIDKLVADYKSGDSNVTSILKKYEIHIIPVLNPDGYEYTHTTFRMWRKNRVQFSGRLGCVGVDLNRNFGFKWAQGGSDTNPCSDVYAGPQADSELETKALQKSIQAKPGYWDAYLTIHTYGNYWLTSWSYTTTNPPDFNDLLAKSNIGANAMTSVLGTKMTTGHSGRLFGVLAGVSDDWAKAVANIKYSHTLELSPGDAEADSFYGFNLPADRIPKVGQALYAGIKAFLQAI